MNLSGTLSDWTVSDLLNVMKVTGKTASLHIKGDRTGTVHFIEGKVVGAALDGKAVPSGDFESRTVASDALFVLNTVQEGIFEVGPFEGPEAQGWDVEDLVSDMQQLGALEEDLAGAGVRDSYVVFKEEIEQAVTVEVEDWWAIASLVSVLSFGQLEDVFGRGRAIRLLHALWRMGLIETLDELPENVTPTPEVILAPQEPAPAPSAVDLSQLDEQGSVEPIEPAPVTVDHEPDDAWLDEIASAAEGLDGDAEDKDTSSESRTVLGVAAPASTVLTGSVLDEMRRLRSRPSD